MNLRRWSLAALAATTVYILVWIGKLPPARLTTPPSMQTTNVSTHKIDRTTQPANHESAVEHDNRGDNPNTTLTDKMSTRLRRIRNLCAEFSEKGTFRHLRLDGYVWHLEAKNITYCVTPKVGSTFWKSVLRYVGHDYIGGNVKRLSDIGGMDVHYAPLEKIKQYNIRSRASRARISGSRTFTFSRDPYTRLWAAYIDKFLLPDFWGNNDSLSIIKYFRQNATTHARRCASDVTFEEFLNYVIYTGSSGVKMNEHWTPLYRLCNPCLMTFDAIGKYESYASDTRDIIQMLNIQHELANLTAVSDNDREQTEITETIRYNFELEEYAVKDCFNKLVIAERLWMIFKFKGYIPEDESFPNETINEFKPEFETGPINLFTQIVLTTVNAIINPIPTNPDESADGFVRIDRNGINTAKARRIQKQKLMYKAYRTISTDILLKIRDLFLIDFQLFDYDANPQEIFGPNKTA